MESQAFCQPSQGEGPGKKMDEKLRKVPRPSGFLRGKRTPLRRLFASGFALVNRVIDKVPFSRFLHGLSWKQLEINWVDMKVLPSGSPFEGLTIAFLSDLHAGLCMNEKDLCEVFGRVSALSPDLVCLGGDLINTREREILLFRKPLKMIRPPLGVFSVPGNHDHFWGEDIGLWESFLERQGVRVLKNRGIHISRGGESLFIAGVDDLTEGVPSLEAALEGRKMGELTILLSHHPDFFFEAAANEVDITLSGHTHGGQIRLFGWSPIHHSKFGWLSGEYHLEGAKLYVGRGIGTTAIPLRFGTKAEIPFIRLVQK